MPLDQVMTFLGRFNDVIKFKLRHPKAAAVDPRLLRALRESSRFNGRDINDAQHRPERTASAEAAETSAAATPRGGRPRPAGGTDSAKTSH